MMDQRAGPRVRRTRWGHGVWLLSCCCITHLLWSLGLKPRTIKTMIQASPFRVRAQIPTVKNVSMAESTVPKWAQKTVSLPPFRRGCHLVTSKIVKEIEPDLSGFKCGLAHLFLQHTSASLTINENYDTDVRDDTETFLNRIVPEGSSAPWKHTLEG
ncbi:unnamed protein product [Sphenostylis stenocarpa]|uniref:Uncharacterized protein n=1 Tax=Sphenostylis stenocarpa TaxID=92480 RepID=A0AA86VIF4_9FABA|nr:unnamed protein product [Sphenostylis stenocarpa]